MIDIVMISTLARPKLLAQTANTLVDNASNFPQYSVTLVCDGAVYSPNGTGVNPTSKLIILPMSQGASAARNIGASSTPKYRRQKYVMFCDDDCYFTPNWDLYLESLAEVEPSCIVSGHAHPFNLPDMKFTNFSKPLVISSVNMLMPWSLWDDVGFFAEPGGAGGSEDWDYCNRAKKKGYGFAVTEPQVILHTGLTSSTGKPIVGQKEVIENNRRLMDIHGLKEVRFE